MHRAKVNRLVRARALPVSNLDYSKVQMNSILYHYSKNKYEIFFMKGYAPRIQLEVNFDSVLKLSSR